MYTPTAFREDDPQILFDIMRTVRLATLVTATGDGLVATPLPLLVVPEEAERGVLYGHVARANSQWRSKPLGEALAIFSGTDAYISPAWYAAKREHGKVVPTWNYIAVHAYGTIEFFEDPKRLADVVTQLTDLHEAGRSDAWKVSDAPADFIAAQLRAIVGVKFTVSRLEGKRKMSQNRPEADRAGVVAGLGGSARETDRQVARLVAEAGPKSR